MALKEYRKKRDFKRTPEPKGDTSKIKTEKKTKQKAKKFSYVIQQHHARRIHYDFRIEVDGVLTSWVIPKGPSTDPEIKRLAVMTEDHPMEYANFEGIIPEGGYGAGSVIVWDNGTYENISRFENMKDAVKAGHIVIKITGKKLKGEFALMRMRARNPFEKEQWLFLKMKDGYAQPGYDVTSEKPKSIVSGLTLEQLEKKHAKKV
ncbi:DNA ligase [Candidatus Woesearchaeota archaeon]|nr:DNA ligase [Candidatus Woesearchaeota archaeon]